MKICSDICTQALSDPGSKQFSKSVQRWLEENCELCGTDNIQGQISDHIFVQNRAYCLYYPSAIFATLTVMKILEYHWDIPQLFSCVTCLDQLCIHK